MDSKIGPWGANDIRQRILTLREQRVMLDADLASLYGVETRALLQAVRRNRERFPPDFMFVLSPQEVAVLRSQTVISRSHGGRRSRPRAFTEQGVAMLSSVLRSSRAIRVNVEIMRTFVVWFLPMRNWPGDLILWRRSTTRSSKRSSMPSENSWYRQTRFVDASDFTPNPTRLPIPPSPLDRQWETERKPLAIDIRGGDKSIVHLAEATAQLHHAIVADWTSRACEVVRLARESTEHSQGLTQQDIAAKLGITQPAVSKMLTQAHHAEFLASEAQLRDALEYLGGTEA